MAKKMIIGQSEWVLSDEDAKTVVKNVKAALESKLVADVELTDNSGRPVVVLVNGQATPVVVFDLDGDPRPTEMS